MVGFMIGADPEIFVRKGGKAVAAYGLIEGTKESPRKTERGAVQVDGLALEFNIDPTNQNDFEGFNQNIVTTMRTLKEMVPGYSFNVSPTQDFDPEYLSSLPAAALELGCDPDYDAYTLKANPRPDGEVAFRTGAGHVHLGWGADIPTENEDHLKICADFVKTLDYTVGLFMTLIDRDPRRRELYGKAGAFRPKSYGVEYRTPSNAWIINRNRRSAMHRLINVAIQYHTAGYPSEKIVGIPQDRVREIINTGDLEGARKAMATLTKWNFDIGSVVAKIEKEMEKADALAEALTEEDASILEKVREG